MKTIRIEGNNAYVDMTVDELIVIKNSLTEVLSQIEPWEFKIRTGFHSQQVKMILDSVVRAIEELN